MKQRYSPLIVACCLVLLWSLLHAALASAGNLDAPAVASSPSSAMYTLEDLYNRLNDGTPGVKRAGAFAMPANPPGSAVHTANEIMAKAPAKNDTDGVTKDMVRQGKTYFGLSSSAWGLQTGTMTTQTISNGSITVNAGYYAATDLATVDTDLITANIRSGVSIFGVAGNANVVNTTGTAAAGDILLGQIAWVNGTQLTGTIPSQALNPASNAVPAGYYGAATLSTVDTDLAAGNIASGVGVFGLIGNNPNLVNTSTGTAAAGDILSGKIGWVNGAQVTGNIATQTVSTVSTTVNAGYYTATTLNAVDADLASANIRGGATIFGVNGTENLMDTAGANAVAGDIGAGLIGVSSAGQVTGTAVFPTTVPARVAKTGQTTSYVAGDDGHLGRGAGMVSPRFKDNANGTVTDNMTGLIWLKNAGCLGGNEWSAALISANTLATGACGLTDGSIAGDWRLPNLDELESLIHAQYASPPLSNTAGTGPWSEGQPFTNVQQVAPYWSSTTSIASPTKAWYVIFDDSAVFVANKTTGCYIWPVRGGQ